MRSLSSCAMRGAHLAIACIFLFHIARACPAPAPCYSITPAPVITNEWYYSLSAYNSYISPTAANVIYDDADFPQMLPGDLTIYYYHCQQIYLGDGYTSPDDSITLQFNTNPGMTTSCPSTCGGTCCRDVYVYPYFSTRPATPAFPSQLDGVSFIFKTTVPGPYEVDVFQHGADPATDPVLVSGFFFLIPKVKQLSVNAPPICAGTYAPNTFYKFNVHTSPSLLTVPDYPFPGYVALTHIGPAMIPECAEIDYTTDMTYRFFVEDSCNNVMNVHRFTDTLSPENDFILDDMYDSNITNFYIVYSDFDSDLTPGIGCFPHQPVIQLKYIDNIAYTTTSPLVVTVPIDIEFPVSAITTGSPTGIPPYPVVGGMTGIPFPSFDMYDYTVSGVVTWTPTSNPMTVLHGGGDTISTIRVQDNITIAPGGQLNIENMTVEMGPAATVTVSPALTSTGSGGWLALYNSTLTAYRGCDVSGPGTDNSTWAGLTILGNPAYTQTLGAFGGPQSQGVLWMNGGTISYADVGLQNGSSPSSSGGIIMIDLGSSTFYNNQLAVNLWPYTNYESGIVASSIESFMGCTFNTDASAWFPVSYYAQVNGIKGAGFRACRFENNTGATMSGAVVSSNSGMIYDNNIIGSTATTYKSFLGGFSDASFTGTTSSSVTGNTFSNCQWAYTAQGTVAPYLLSNTFNIPSYSGTGLVHVYPGTDVLMVNDQNIGAFMYGTPSYYMVNNIFKGASSGYYPYTSGTIELSTGNSDNQVTDNSFTGLGVAMNSNYVNNAGSASVYSGLQYLCNTTAHNDYDINVVGNDAVNGGINPWQATSSGSSTFDLAAGNTFTGTISLYDQQLFLTYRYNASGAGETPLAYWGPVSFVPSPHAHCYAVSNSTSTGAFSIAAAGSYSVGSPDGPTGPYDIGLNYSIAVANVNYYMTDTGAPHRDSVYYWAGQMNSPYGDLLIANMLIEDSLIDSADTVYDHIPYKFGLQGPELNDFVQGRSLMDVLIAKREGDRNLYALAASQISTLQSVKANATMWAHVRAENWLHAVTGEALVDTFLYPPSDTSFETSSLGGLGDRISHNAAITNSPAMKNMVFPNPVHDLVQVMYTAKTNDNVMIQIEDVSGRQIITQQFLSGVQTAIDMSNLVPGIYIYRISEGSRVTMIGKITKD